MTLELRNGRALTPDPRVRGAAIAAPMSSGCAMRKPASGAAIFGADSTT